MASIISTLSGENRIVMNDTSRFARGSAIFGGSWTKVRVGIRYCVSDTGANMTGVQFGVGICAGSTNINGDASPSHYLGFRLVGNSAILVRGAGPPVNYLWNYTAATVVVAGVVSDSGDIEGGNYYTAAANTNRVLLFCDISKSFNTYTLNYFRNTNIACSDVSQATFDAQVLAQTPVVTDHAYSNSTTRTADEATNGLFDHINLSWVNTSGATLKISDIAAVRLG